MTWAKFIVTAIYTLGCLFPVTSHAYRYEVVPARATYSAQEVEFIVSYKSYVKTLLHMQAAETRKRLICLGEEYLTPVSLRPDLAEQVQDLVNQYRRSEECRKFKEEEVIDILANYYEMRVHLALHQSSQNEMIERRYNFGLGSQPTNFVDCNQIQNSIHFGSVDLCLNQLLTIANPYPSHILRKFSIASLDRYLSNFEVPEVVRLMPLTWDEVVYATEIFSEKYLESRSNTNLSELSGNIQNENQNILPDELVHPNELARRERERHTENLMRDYFAATVFQAQGSYVFSQYPENSAPRKYVEILTKYPVLAFFERPTVDFELDCQSENILRQNLTSLCLSYLSSLESRGQRPHNYGTSLNRHIYPALVDAYEKVLKLNQSLIQALDMKYDSTSLFNSQYQITTEGDLTSVGDWKDIIAMESALQNFLNMYPNYQGLETKFVSEYQREQNVIMVLQIGGAVALGFGCAFVGNAPLLAGCLVLAGIGVNLYFYNDTLDKHNEQLRRYFSSSVGTSSQGHLLSLVEFESMRTQVQGIFLETLFLGVGISANRIGVLSLDIARNLTRR